MANTQNNSQAQKTKEKSGWSRRLVILVKQPICRLNERLKAHTKRLVTLVKQSVCRLWRWLNQHPINWFMAVFIFIFVVCIFFDPVPKLISYLLGDGNKRGTLTFIGVGIGGLVLWKRTISAEQQAKAMNDTARNQVEENKLTEAGHTQERLKTSIEHLGKNKESVRIGAAYELYHLAKVREYRETACDILCGHIRQKTQEEDYKKKHGKQPPEELKTFLNLLCRRKEEGKEGGPFRECQIDLSPSFLQGAGLSKAQLQGANLSWAELRRANLSWAELQGANLSWAELQGANLSWAELQETNLSWAKLQGADLPGAKLQGADLSEANLQGTDLSEAKLQGADLSGAKLQGADLSGAKLQGADLSGAKLQGADLSGTNLQGADLSGAKLQGADLSGAKLQGISSFGELPKMSFQDRIRARTGKKNDFTNVVFSGGLDAERIEKIIASMPAGMEDERKEEMKNKLNERVDEEAASELPDNSGAIIGKYTEDDAEKWIADYEKSTNHQPAKDE